MERIRNFFAQHDQYAAHNGIRIVEVREGYARASMSIAPHHLNGVGVVHGAALFALGDLAFAVASNSRGMVAVGINANISFMKGVKSGVLEAEACEEQTSRQLGHYMVRIRDEDGNLVALFTGMVYRKNEALPIEAPDT